jgi:hypothetical protein
VLHISSFAVRIAPLTVRTPKLKMTAHMRMPGTPEAEAPSYGDVVLIYDSVDAGPPAVPWKHDVSNMSDRSVMASMSHVRLHAHRPGWANSACGCNLLSTCVAFEVHAARASSTRCKLDLRPKLACSNALQLAS